MTTLRPCRACSTPVAPDAKACPKCGKPDPAGRSGRFWLYLFGAFILVIAFGPLVRDGRKHLDESRILSTPGDSLRGAVILALQERCNLSVLSPFPQRDELDIETRRLGDSAGTVEHVVRGSIYASDRRRPFAVRLTWRDDEGGYRIVSAKMD